MGFGDATEQQLLGFVVALDLDAGVFHLDFGKGLHQFPFGILIGDQRFEDDRGRIFHGFEDCGVLRGGEGIAAADIIKLGEGADIASPDFVDGIELFARHDEHRRDALRMAIWMVPA